MRTEGFKPRTTSIISIKAVLRMMKFFVKEADDDFGNSLGNFGLKPNQRKQNMPNWAKLSISEIVNGAATNLDARRHHVARAHEGKGILEPREMHRMDICRWLQRDSVDSLGDVQRRPIEIEFAQ